MDEHTSIFIPNIYKKESKNTVATVMDQKLSENITSYIKTHIERLIKPFETFEHEDIKPNTLNLIHELQDAVDNSVKKTGDIVSGSLHILKSPQAKMDAVNKEYVDWLFLESKLANNDLDLNHFKIKNVQAPSDLGDAVTKNYVDQKFESLSGYLNQPQHHIFSKEIGRAHV